MASPPAMPGTAGATQGWIIVEAEHEEAILKEGYRCKKRKEVPFTAYLPTHGAKAFTRWHKPEIGVALEVHGVDESLIECEGTGGHIKMDHLPPGNLRSGEFLPHGPTEVYHPCPFCGKEREGKFKTMHTAVGKRYFAGEVELVAPGCCHDQQAERQKRLEKGITVTLYHQTSQDFAEKIMASGKLLRGSTGTAGGAIYFAFSPLQTRWKAAGTRGAILECEVQLGKILTSDISDQKAPNYQVLEFVHLMQRASRGHEWASLKLCDEIGDSILLNRGNNLHDGKAQGLPSGPEVVVYTWQQVMVKRVLDLQTGHPYVKPRSWLPDEVEKAYAQFKGGTLTFSQYEDVFYRHAECLRVYRGVAPDRHLDVAMKLLGEERPGQCGCGQPTYNGQWNELCRKSCAGPKRPKPAFAPRGPAQCGCGAPTWNGQWNETCKRSCTFPKLQGPS